MAMLISDTSVSAAEIYLKKKEPPTDPDSLRRLASIPAIAFINNDELTVAFDYPVGAVAIIIADESENVVYYSLIDTSIQQGVVIPVDTLISGDYSLQIEYEAVVLTGEFSL